LFVILFAGEGHSQRVIAWFQVLDHQATLAAYLPFERVVEIDLRIRGGLYHLDPS
jgi:hypothetical protein